MRQDALLRRMARAVLRDRLSVAQRRRLRQRLQLAWARLFHPRDLVALAVAAETDKWGSHFYCRQYQHHLAAWRRRRFTLLEIGIGGYDDPEVGGESLRMWAAYFPRAHIAGLDLAEKRGMAGGRISVHRGSQADPDLLRGLVKELGGVDVVVDDGSHQCAHVIASFETLFPLLPAGGLYFVEDTQTSYWPEFGGSLADRTDPATTMGYFTALADAVNHREFRNTEAPVTDLMRAVTGLHFYHNLIVIEKGAG